MILTEQEARTKWCPNGCGPWVGSDPYEFACCGGSQCMLWVWNNCNYGMPVEIPKAEWTGYCGLGGGK